jgi:hypothetical protein
VNKYWPNKRISAAISADGRAQLADEKAYVRARRRLDGGAHRFRALDVPGGPRQSTLGGPASVSVHDDRDMHRL